MSDRIRLGCLIVLLLVGIVELRRISRGHPVPPPVPLRHDFDTFPTRIGEWSGKDLEGLSPTVKLFLAADNYLLRSYRNDVTGAHVDLLILYYSSQSSCFRSPPVHIDPGPEDWKQRVSSDVVQIPNAAIPGESFAAKHDVIKKGDGVHQTDALHWCQVHGRMFPTEPSYLGKIYLVWDGITKGNTNGAALIRLTAVRSCESDESYPAMVKFAQDLSSVLPQFLPN